MYVHTLEQSLVIAGSIELFDHDSFRAVLSTAFDVNPSSVRLRIGASSIRVDMRVTAASEQVKEAVKARMAAFATDRALASSWLGVTVEAASEPVESMVMSTASSTSPPSLTPLPLRPPAVSPPAVPLVNVAEGLATSLTATLTTNDTRAMVAAIIVLGCCVCIMCTCLCVLALRHVRLTRVAEQFGEKKTTTKYMGSPPTASRLTNVHVEKKGGLRWYQPEGSSRANSSTDSSPSARDEPVVIYEVELIVDPASNEKKKRTSPPPLFAESRLRSPIPTVQI